MYQDAVKTLHHHRSIRKFLDKELAEFDQLTADYYQARSNIDNNWSKNVIKALDKPVRPGVLPYLQQGFAKK